MQKPVPTTTFTGWAFVMDRGNGVWRKLRFVCIFSPLIGACLLPLIGRRAPRVRNFFSLLFVFVAFVCAAALLPAVLAGENCLCASRCRWG